MSCEGSGFAGVSPSTLYSAMARCCGLTQRRRARVGPGWQHEGVEHGRNEPLTVPQAREIAGKEFRHYIQVRARAEAEWLRELGQWCERMAESLERELPHLDGVRRAYSALR